MASEALAQNLFDSGERKTLAEMQSAHLPRCTPEAIGARFTINDKCPEADRAQAEADQRDVTERLTKYLAAFLPPGPCVKCGATLAGKSLVDALWSSFEWGLAHGEGHCSRCGYPARGLHYVDLGEAGELKLPRVLQYHPDELTEGR